MTLSESSLGAVTNLGLKISSNAGPIIFMAGGQQWSFFRFDLAAPWHDFLYNYTNQSVQPINLTITAPVPSALLLLCAGLIGLLASPRLQKKRFAD
jgi:hypothetical protein